MPSGKKHLGEKCKGKLNGLKLKCKNNPAGSLPYIHCDCSTEIRARILLLFSVIHTHFSDLTLRCRCQICGHKIDSMWLKLCCLHREETHDFGPCKIISSGQSYLVQSL